MTVDVKIYRSEKREHQSQPTTENVKEYTLFVKAETLQRTIKNKQRTLK